MANKTILIVDDDEDIRYSVRDGLSAMSNDYEVLEAKDGNHALELLKKHYVDLVILDIMMPVMDGFTLAAKIKEDASFKHIPIIYLSAKTDEYSKALGGMSAKDYIEKPFELTDLKDRIDNIIK